VDGVWLARFFHRHSSGTDVPDNVSESNTAARAFPGPGRLKTWQILRKLRCCPWRAGQFAKAIHALQAREITG
jgi:hypothetical protein